MYINAAGSMRFVAFDTAALGGVFNFKSPPALEKERERETVAACKGEKVKTMAIYWLLRPIYDREFSCLIQTRALYDVYVLDSLALFHARAARAS
jgi:hypothetical protein